MIQLIIALDFTFNYEEISNKSGFGIPTHSNDIIV